MLIDTHCHLNFKAFEEDWREAVKRAKEAGVEKMVVVGTDLKSSQRAVELAEEMEGLYATAGFHPHHCRGLKGEIKEIEAELKKLAKSKKVVAIGECGLDYSIYRRSKYKSKEVGLELKNLQKRVFGTQIQLAKELDLPLVIHNREAEEDLMDTMEHFCKPAPSGRGRVEGKYPRGVLHCISGSQTYLKQVLEMGFYIGVDGNVTYSQEVQRLIEKIPVEKLVLETDAPFLTPVPYRGLRNEPKNVTIVAEFVAKLKKLSLNKIQASSSKNAEALFNI